MLSILIPVYNVEVYPLVVSLLQQTEKLEEAIEIICLDDHSEAEIEEQNHSSLSKLNIRYQTLAENAGRGKIRRMLAERAKFNSILFLDCDMLIENEDFIKNYLKYIDHDVVVGGLTYSSSPPGNSDLMLRWKYGSRREQKSAEERSNMRFSHFMASNLLIKRELFLSIPLNPEISGYGHEDTMLGLKLQEKGVGMLHIDNPSLHNGLDPANEFLVKSVNGLENLARLYRNEHAGEELKLISLFKILERFYFKKTVRNSLGLLVPAFERNLKGKNPKLWVFDLWKLYHFLTFCH